ncbi:GTPase HflX [Beijerinckia mobilis]|uniref:GTPase HflX n=1 Tax=Beijerinckia mobilis TaxID=231434 RepID=UPI00068D5C3C|nr:GTPase HflX [Beijerinckia mobilis]
MVIGPYFNQKPANPLIRSAEPAARTPEARFDEILGLAEALDLDIVDRRMVSLAEIKPSTYLGSGKVAELGEAVKTAEAELVVMDCALSPVQQRNLEKAFAAKVIDRTGLILEIFGRRARTREGSLQVELAHLSYQKSRLVRSWTHLERQRGGFGFLGGPGETQIEADRRLLQERMTRLEQELAGVKRTRGLHRKTRRDVPYPIIALVGYTNAGKSTLFNRLTKAEVLAQNMLFATLDPTLRSLSLPHGSKVILSDTVGFISDLPTMLVKAFHATLEEVLEADLILHVRDISHPDAEAQRLDVENVLSDLGIDTADEGHILEVWNKADLLDDDSRETVLNNARRDERRPILVSALTGQGIEALESEIESRLAQGRLFFDITLGPADGEGQHWLHEHTEVMGKSYDDDGTVRISVRVAPERAEPIRRRFGAAVVEQGAMEYAGR